MASDRSRAAGYVKLMSDYIAESPLWDRQGNIVPEDLGLSAELAADLRAWQAHFEAHLDHLSGWDSDEARQWHADQVEDLASRLRTELGPDVALELQLWPLDPPQPRSYPSSLALPFRLRDRAGVVTVKLAPNHDPDELGHGLVAIGYDGEAFRGFPCVVAEIEYSGEGPRAWMGWLQVVERQDTDGAVYADVDTPAFTSEVSPLYTFGYLPTFSDFPANPDHPDGDWIAFTFLVAVPDVVRSRILEPVVAFRWGYRLTGGRPVELFDPVQLAIDAWEQHRGLLEAQYPQWEFRPPATRQIPTYDEVRRPPHHWTANPPQ